MTDYICLNCNATFRHLVDYEEHKATVGWNGKCKENRGEMMFTKYEYNGYRIFLQDENFDDKSCNWRTYIVNAPDGSHKFFHIENEYINDRSTFIKRAHEVINHMEKNRKIKMSGLPVEIGCIASYIPEDKLPEYFEKAKSIIDQNEIGCFSLFGMTFIEILEMIKEKRMSQSKKLTREEAQNILIDIGGFASTGTFLKALEALGVVKFEEEKKQMQITICEKITDKYGVIRLEEWLEGLVLWVGGEIKWKSWLKYYGEDDVFHQGFSRMK